MSHDSSTIQRLRVSSVSSPAELVKTIDTLQGRIQELEELVNILSAGKYQWESTFDAITSPVTLISSDYVIQRANLNVAKRIDDDITRVVGKRCFEVFAKRTSPCPGCPVAKALRKDWYHTSRLEEPIQGKDYEVNAYPYVGKTQDTRDWAVVYYRDITEEKRLHHELVQQEKMAAIGMLAGGVAHEINNPLGGILALAQLMLRDIDGVTKGSLQSDLDEIEKAALRCKKIVADLLDFSRSSTGESYVLVDINQMIEKVFPFLRMEFRSLNVKLQTTLEPTVPKILGDVTRLQQVILNLLTNACHALKEGGVISVSTVVDHDAKEVHIVVSDDGEGISRENLNRVFDPFFTTKAPGSGTGLGLSISYRIIKDHQGTIDVTSEKGSGTRFTIRLPITAS